MCCRERALLRFTHAARQRLLRLRVIVGHGTRVRHRAGCRSLQWLSSLKVHDAVLQNAPQKLFEEHQRLAIFVPVPIFDVSTALTVFARGFMPLPGFIGEFNQAPTRPSGRKRRLLVAQANSLVYRLLHQSRWPKGLKLIQVWTPAMARLHAPVAVLHKHLRSQERACWHLIPATAPLWLHSTAACC